MKRRALLSTLLVGVACHATPSQRPRATTIRSCSYQVALDASGTARVDASCVADGPFTFRLAHRYLRHDVHTSAPARQGRFEAARQHLAYSVDLRALAARSDDLDRAAHVGASFVAPVSSILLVPEPLSTEIEVVVDISAPPDVGVAVGLTRASGPQKYRLMAHEIPVATYFAFGKLEQRSLDVDGARLELTRLDGALDRSFDEVTRWVETSARAVRGFYGTFPVPRASITVIPIPKRDGVVFGKVLPESEPGVALLLGQHVSRPALYSDWILVHELFHLGFPSFSGEGKWLDEGLATYYEPIIRVRAGLYTESQLWDELESQMPRGVSAFTELGLEHADEIYWGGAIACLVADVAARKRLLHAGLEVGLRALRDAGGTAAEVWTVAEVVEKVDQALGAPILADVVKAHAAHGSPFDLQALFADLGVGRDAKGALQLSESAPLAAVRHAITRDHSLQ